MVRRRTAAVLPNNLPHLQNLVKRDPKLYREEFLQQWNHYQTAREVFLVNPGEDDDEFANLIGFLAQTCNHYHDVTKNFPAELAQLLQENHEQLHPDVAEKIVQSLVLLKNKTVISSFTLLKWFFSLLNSNVNTSKALRKNLYEQISTTIRNENKKSRNEKLNKVVQTALFTMVENAGTVTSKVADYTNKKKEYTVGEMMGVWAVRLVQDLWRRKIWSGDARAVEIMKTAALSPNTKVMLAGIHFFLGVDSLDAEDDSDEDEGPDLKKLLHQSNINKKSKSREAQMQKARASLKRKERLKNAPPINVNFPALQLLHDPQGFADDLYERQLSGNKRKLPLEHKLVVLQLLSRLVGSHRLIVLGLYSYMMKYMTPHQRDVTQILACAAQASHEFVPPDTLEPLIRKIADEFVTSGVASEVVCAGINGIREICARAPFAMTPELLQDLTEYKSSKDKGVMMASRGLLSLYRDIAPEMLKRKDRGKLASMEFKERKPLRYGEDLHTVEGIQGLDLLEKYKAENGEEENEDDWKAWEAIDDSSSDSDSEGWININSDDEISISDSGDDDGEEGNSKKLQTEKPEVGSQEPVDLANSIAVRTILTPADLKKLEELREKEGVERLVNGPKRLPKTNDVIDAIDIEGPRKKQKADREARLASVMEGREGREKYASKRSGFMPTSLSNKRKQRNKNFMMMKHKAKNKKSRSLHEKQRILRAHVERERKQI
ncbi:SDA1 family protein [Schizosaccharomyces japonicus yFS275]|uniref:Protein SDA1 n=1 Tax=Schizosaccharomyces japonicus (strain yFS275 / FY16936) TaxID=402676 RepID=B6K6H6_SCHJY|nr:SDA1 family protein [Schizosaccharomyces japonicus yFS275]EEB09130.1 SDA1 family protein [Schizosaccharomyces japonicus yFS275]